MFKLQAVFKKTIVERLKNLFRPFKRILNINQAIKAPILGNGLNGKIVSVIKQDSFEDVYFPKIHDLFPGGQLEFKSPALNIIEYRDATIFPLSDYFLLGEGAVWHKSHLPQFIKSVPQDRNLLKVQDGILYINRTTKSIKVKTGFSICGVYADVWAHFLVQFLPKLYLIEELVKSLKQPITVIMPKYLDKHIHEIVFSYLLDLEGIEILELELGEAAICETLYHIDNTAYIMDTSKYISPSDVIIAPFVAESLKKNLVRKYLAKMEQIIEPQTKDLKLYIARTGGRNVLNSEEIEAYFIKKGFKIIAPHQLSFTEKVKLFSKAQCVVGPCSSGFMNIIFCKPKTKMLSFINFSRAFEAYFGFLGKYFQIDVLLLTGADEHSHEINSSYSIPLEKIISACNKFGI